MWGYEVKPRRVLVPGGARELIEPESSKEIAKSKPSGVLVRIGETSDFFPDVDGAAAYAVILHGRLKYCCCVMQLSLVRFVEKYYTSDSKNLDSYSYAIS